MPVETIATARARGGLRPSMRMASLCAAMLLAQAAMASAPQSAPQPLTAGGNDIGDLPIEELLNLEISTASKFAQRQSDAPGSVSVITAAEIKAFGWRTLGDLLRSVRGLYVTYDRNYERLGARGFQRPGDYNGRFLLMIDGARINDGVYDNAAIGSEFPLDLEMIERVEYVAGPGSSIYGTNAFFGVINVLTKRGRDQAGGQAGLMLGSAGSGQLLASYGWRGPEGSEFLLAASGFSSRGKDQYYAEFGRSANGLDYDRAQRFFLRGGQGNLQFTLAHADRKKGIPTASYEQVFNDPRSRTDDTFTLASLRYSATLAPKLEWQASLNYSATDYEGLYAYPRDTIVDGSRARQWQAEWKLVSTQLAGHKLVAGFELARETQRDQYYYTLPFLRLLMGTRGVSSSADFADHRTNSRTAVFLQDEVALGDAVLLNVGIRHDGSSAVSGETSPRVALVWKAAPGTRLKALYGNAFRAANAYELYYAIAAGLGGQDANPNLRAERIKSSELLLEHDISASSRLTVSLFENKVKNLITQADDSQGGLQFQNQDRASARGIGLEYQRIWDDGMRLRTSMNWQHAKDDDSGERLALSPQMLAKLNLSAPLWRGALRSGVELQYVGERKSLAGMAPAYWLANVQLGSARLLPGLDVSLGIFNLFDRRYADPGSTEHVQDLLLQDGRSLRLKFVAAF